MDTLKASAEKGSLSFAARLSSGLGDGVHPLHGRDVLRRREEIDDGIQDGLNPLVSQSRPAQDGHELERHGGLANGPDQFGIR